MKHKDRLVLSDEQRKMVCSELCELPYEEGRFWTDIQISPTIIVEAEGEMFIDFSNEDDTGVYYVTDRWADVTLTAIEDGREYDVDEKTYEEAKDCLAKIF